MILIPGDIMEKLSRNQSVCHLIGGQFLLSLRVGRSLLQTLLSSDDNQDIPSSNPINQISSRNLLVFRQLRPASSRLHFLNLPQSTVILNFHTSFAPLSHRCLARMPMLCENFITGKRGNCWRSLIFWTGSHLRGRS